ncbi:MAG: hypothetical protein JW940_06935 [Polyangiaceae bacterium]|nr:hypothetical protein [Polyangiaceae bacterium]
MTHPSAGAAKEPVRILSSGPTRVLLLGGFLIAHACAEPAKDANVDGPTGGKDGTTETTTGGGGSSSGGKKTGGTSGKNDSGGGNSTSVGVGGNVPTNTKLQALFGSYSPTQPTFQLKNNDPDNFSYVLLASLRMSYWFTPEGPLSKYTTRCDQIDSRGNTVQCSDVVLTIVDGDPARLDIEFDVPATWRLWGTDSISRLNLGLMNDNTQGTQPDLTNDYSYVKPSGDFTVDDKIAIYQDGVLAWGKEPEGAVTATGGAGTGGAQSAGGSGSGGTPATGGTETGGDQPAGGAGTGGSEATGGSASGGAEATAGTGMGGVESTGGSATAGSDATGPAGAGDSGADAGSVAGSSSAGSPGG